MREREMEIDVIITCHNFRRKLTNKLKEADEALSGLQAKHSSLEKTKKRISDELEDLNLDLEKVDLHTYSLNNSYRSSRLIIFVRTCRNVIVQLPWRRSRSRLTSKSRSGSRGTMRKRRSFPTLRGRHTPAALR
jgi:hypothetical protein